ncbi:hypothetical protein EJB05_52792, partial [Eragrostis curvula]
MRSPDLMSKLQVDVRRKVPEGQELVSETNLADINYMRAVIKETLRLHSVTPVLAHFSMSSCSIDGFEVPARVDERFWEDADEFIPKRFLDDGGAADVEFKGNDFRFFPFGVGRRMCPGMNFGMAAIEAILANLMHHFDWELLSGQERRNIQLVRLVILQQLRFNSYSVSVISSAAVTLFAVISSAATTVKQLPAEQVD